MDRAESSKSSTTSPNIDEISATGLNVNVTSGSTYWFNVFNASVPSGDPVFWDENSGVGCHSQGCPSQAYESAVGTIASEAFDIGGSGPPPPTCYQSGGKFQIIHDFTKQEAPIGPSGGVTMDEAGNLYGIASGGVNSQGLVYKLAPSGQNWLLTPLYSFLGGSNGFDPGDVAIGPDRALYGPAQGGIQNCPNGNYCGLVYSVRPAPTACLTALCSWTENVLYQFAGGNDAWYPNGDLMFDQAGNLYGTTYWGGGPGCNGNGCGTVFKLTPSSGGWTEKVLYSFTGGTDGGVPTSLLLGNDGNLYGTTAYGGDPNCYHDGGITGCGTVFQLSPSGSGWTETVLYNFQDTQSDGAWPDNLIQDSAGNLYGTSCLGWGCAYESYSYVTVFNLSPSNGKWVFTAIFQELVYVGVGGGETGINNLTIDAAGNLYGTTAFFVYYDGGYERSASIFKLVPEGSGWQVIYVAPFGNSLFDSIGHLALDAQGDLYGTSSSCGKYGYGTIWQLSP